MDEAYDYQRGVTAIWPGTDHLVPESVLTELATYTEDNDRAGRLDDRSVAALRDCGYLALPVPTTFHGGGASLTECCAVQRRIGAVDPALAIGLNMHLFSMGYMVEHWLRHNDESWRLLESIARSNHIVASAFAEPGLGGSLTRSNCTARREGDHWVVNGLKVPCSLAERSDVLCLQMIDEAGGPQSLLVAIVPTATPGIEVVRTWNTLGMRASESDTVRLVDCPIPDDLIVHRGPPGGVGDEVFAAGNAWFCTTATACYLGVASAAVDQARAALSNSKISHLGTTRASLPSFQSALGDILTELLPLDAACARLAGLIDEHKLDPRNLTPAMLALRHQSVDIAIRAVELASELVGVASYAATGPASRLIRDVHAARYHPPTRFVTRQLLGRWALGLPWSFELTERPYEEA
ncbi:acyl-CoA dehydrogenase family protein [Actinosynnema sp. NPDC023587]|uniref:acyl-CoA dehydrogenase family protein n=1 Tax=Actinosynnema sp. NPDC023587 TaxID=3154695 RepID=UPI003407C048